jgi:pyruvate dehydrogenase E2 component (dihydrolipoamide acetyltransferase)
MAIEITVPRLGWTMEEGVFLGWLKNDGDAVREGEALYTLESDKSAQEVEATENGILRISPRAPVAGGKVRVGELLGYLAAEGESVEFRSRESGVRNQESGVTNQPPEIPAEDGLQNFDVSSAPTISPRAARTAAALGVDWTKIRGTGRTGRIRERDVLAAAAKLTPDP